MNEERKDNRPIEGQVSKLLNDEPTEVVIAGSSYRITPPTFAKLARISEEVAALTIGEMDAEQLVQDTLREARKTRQVARVIAVMIDEEKPRRSLFAKLFKRKEVTLEERLYNELTPREANEVVAELIGTMQLGDFFALTTFLRGVNLTKRTREVES